MEAPTPTIHDVAKKSGVSTATVSRCLNSPAQVTEKTRIKVMAAVVELGYTPNFGARAMAARRTNTIGAIIPTMENAIFARGLQAFQEELATHGFTMLVASTSYQPEQEDVQIRSLVARGADALLLIGHDRAPSIYKFLDAQQVPALVTWSFDPEVARPSVGFDNRAAMQEMAEAVIAQGHRNIAFITADIAINDRTRARLAGIRDAMTYSGMNPDDLRVIETPYGIDNGAMAFKELMRSNVRPTAVLCANDVLAVGAMRQARAMGIDVPRDVSITGFDDMEIAQIVFPPLTTVHVPHADMGRRAAQELIKMVHSGAQPEATEIPATFVRRASLGPAAQ